MIRIRAATYFMGSPAGEVGRLPLGKTIQSVTIPGRLRFLLRKLPMAVQEIPDRSSGKLPTSIHATTHAEPGQKLKCTWQKRRAVLQMAE